MSVRVSMCSCGFGSGSIACSAPLASVWRRLVASCGVRVVVEEAALREGGIFWLVDQAVE